MLSAGMHHKRIPKDRKRNLEWRKYILQEADNNPSVRQQLIQACREDILFYINTFVWQHNPKKKGREVGPFISWDFQDRTLTSRDPKKPGILWCIEHGEDVVIEKSRDMGASWLCLIAFEWLWHFHDDQNFIVISRNEDAVDKKGTPSSLFWKLDHILKNQPAWLLPKGWDWGNKKCRMDLQFINPENRSVITGEASGTGKAGVGGRATAMFLDEFSQVTEDRETLHRTADTTDCRIFNGTHVGLGTAFYKLTIKPDIKKVVMHWSEHPDKGAGAYHWEADSAKVVPHDPAYKYPADFVFDTSGRPTGGPFPGVRSPWYDAQSKRRGSEREIAMDLDIDARGSVSTFFDALMINQLKLAHGSPPFWRGDLHYDEETGKPKELVSHAEGQVKLWMVPSPGMAFNPGRYAAGADISWGVGATPSCFSAVNVDTGVKVLEFVTSRHPPEKFAAYCVALCRMLKGHDGDGALFCWEAAGPGLQFGKAVMALGYRRVYYRIDEFDPDADRTSKPGWFPAPKHKMTILSDYRAALANGEMENRSLAALDETLLFKYNDRGDIVHSEEASEDDPSGARINHADRVIADALAWKMCGEVGGRQVVEETEKAAPVMSMQWRRERAERLEKKERGWI